VRLGQIEGQDPQPVGGLAPASADDVAIETAGHEPAGVGGTPVHGDVERAPARIDPIGQRAVELDADVDGLGPGPQPHGADPTARRRGAGRQQAHPVGGHPGMEVGGKAHAVLAGPLAGQREARPLVPEIVKGESRPGSGVHTGHRPIGSGADDADRRPVRIEQREVQRERHAHDLPRDPQLHGGARGRRW
jgi:hypothetical protein